MAEQSKQQVTMPLIGDMAPAFKAKTTMGEINFPDDYKGK
jgi:peroxiredoxin (alkyl hydroperoxide reductase subunit C)